MTLTEEILKTDTQILLYINNNHSPALDRLAGILTSPYTWIPLYISLIALIVKNNPSLRRYTAIIASVIMGVLCSSGINELLIKPLVARARPINDGQLRETLHIISHTASDSYSFYSSHASNTFTIALLLSLMIRNKKIGMILVTWSLINCWTRLYLGMHYPSDIICGLFFASLLSLFIYAFYLRALRQVNRSDLAPTSSFTRHIKYKEGHIRYFTTASLIYLAAIITYCITTH